jgi:hypothetical protein
MAINKPVVDPAVAPTLGGAGPDKSKLQPKMQYGNNLKPMPKVSQVDVDANNKRKGIMPNDVEKQQRLAFDEFGKMVKSGSQFTIKEMRELGRRFELPFSEIYKLVDSYFNQEDEKLGKKVNEETVAKGIHVRGG